MSIKREREREREREKERDPSGALVDPDHADLISGLRYNNCTE